MGRLYRKTEGPEWEGVRLWGQASEFVEGGTGEGVSNGVVVTGDVSGSDYELMCD